MSKKSFGQRIKEGFSNLFSSNQKKSNPENEASHSATGTVRYVQVGQHDTFLSKVGRFFGAIGRGIKAFGGFCARHWQMIAISAGLATGVALAIVFFPPALPFITTFAVAGVAPFAFLGTMSVTLAATVAGGITFTVGILFGTGVNAMNNVTGANVVEVEVKDTRARRDIRKLETNQTQEKNVTRNVYKMLTGHQVDQDAETQLQQDPGTFSNMFDAKRAHDTRTSQSHEATITI